MSFEEKDLATHVQLCELRYKALEEKINGVEKRLGEVEAAISSIKSHMESGFSEIKILLERQNNARTIQIIATIGTIAAAGLGMIGYLLHR